MSEPQDVVRLSVNLTPEIAASLRSTAKDKGLNVTDAVNDAVAVWHHLQAMIAQGHTIAVIKYGKPYELVIR
ncbi:RelB-like antitoxin [Gordonia phage ODay]|nr:RelB-like antitoxin [Gordonia phage ODay]